MLGYVVSFLLGLGVGGLYPMLRRRRPSTGTHSAGEIPAAVQESVTAFGEEVAASEFDASSSGATPAVLKEYRAMLEAYGRASAARTETDALAALRDGRAAMIRLDARRHGRPVPIDALPPAAAGPSRSRALTGTGERHVSTGSGDGAIEVLIDRPEPGRPALLEADVTGEGSFRLQTMTRTEDVTHTGRTLVSSIGEYHGRRHLPADATHLRITTTGWGDDIHWSTRVLPLSAATTLTSEHRGHGDEVLRHNGGPALLTVQFRTDTDTDWSVRYLCECLRTWEACDCRPPAWPKGAPGIPHGWLSDLVTGAGDGRSTLRLPRPGFVTVHEGSGSGSWYLTTQPVDIPPPPPKRQGRRR